MGGLFAELRLSLRVSTTNEIEPGIFVSGGKLVAFARGAADFVGPGGG
jgi:hypothetical protein